MPGARRKATFCTRMQLSDHDRIAPAMQGNRDNVQTPAGVRLHPVARTSVVVIVTLIVASALISGSTKHFLLGGFPSFLRVDKVGHAMGFGAMGFAFVRSRFACVRPWHVLGFALALGALTELFQRLVPGRTSKLGDVLIDLAGACVGVHLARRAWSGWRASRPD